MQIVNLEIAQFDPNAPPPKHLDLWDGGSSKQGRLL